MGSCEKFRNFKFFHGFWIEVIWIFMMADLVSQKKGACPFFLWKCLVSLHFLNLKTPIEDSRLRHCRDFVTPLSHREAFTGLAKVIVFYGQFLMIKYILKEGSPISGYQALYCSFLVVVESDELRPGASNPSWCLGRISAFFPMIWAANCQKLEEKWLYYRFFFKF